MAFIKKLVFGQHHKTARANPVYTKLVGNLHSIWHNTSYKDIGIERTVRLLLVLVSFVMPATLVRWILGHSSSYAVRRVGIEGFGLLKPIWYLVALSFAWTNHPLVVGISVIMSIDTLHFLAARVFLADMLKEPISYKRSLLLVLVNFIEITLLFAIIYFYISSLYGSTASPAFAPATLSRIQCIYFSVVTAATIGYGDITAKSTLAMAIVICQVLTSFVFVVVIIANIASKMDNTSNIAPLKDDNSPRRPT